MQISSQPSPFTDITETPKQTPTSPKAIRVLIGPGDPVSSIPVVMDYDQHQIHEGESFMAQDIQASLNISTVKYSLVVGAFPVPIQAPHLRVSCSVYGGSAQITLYEGGTGISGGASITPINRNRGIALPGNIMAVTGGVTATGTTMLSTNYIGAGNKASAIDTSDEWVLKQNTTYIVYLTGLVNATQAIIHFDWYQDVGV